MSISKYILLCFLTIVSAFDYSLEDLNPSSEHIGQFVGPSVFSGEVTLHYFGHFIWGLCTARFGQLNDFYNDLLLLGYDQIKLIGIGKNQHINAISNWTDGNDASVVADDENGDVWDLWDASQRDLFILDHVGELVFSENISSTDAQGNVWAGGVPSAIQNMIVSLINDIPIDEELLGDVNGDLMVNIVDVVALVDIILNTSSDNLSADVNQDGLINIVDVVMLIDMILNG